MHKSSLLRMKWFVQNYVKASAPASVLDIGSYDVNGSYKELFTAPHFSYTGLDMEDGPNVDIAPAAPYKWAEVADNSFDVLISGQALEHVEFFWFTLAEMVRVLRPGGLMCIIVPRGFSLHRHPVDCYRFDADGMVALARYCNMEPLHASTNLAPPGASSEWYSYKNSDSLLVAKKPMDWKGMVEPETYAFKEEDMFRLATGFIPEKQNFIKYIFRKFF